MVPDLEQVRAENLRGPLPQEGLLLGNAGVTGIQVAEATRELQAKDDARLVCGARTIRCVPGWTQDDDPHPVDG